MSTYWDCVRADCESPCPKCEHGGKDDDCDGWVTLGECRQFKTKGKA